MITVSRLRLSLALSLVAVVCLGQTYTGLTPLMNLMGVTDSTGALVTIASAASGANTPLTALANLRGRTDSTGALNITVAGGALTPATLAPTGKLTTYNGVTTAGWGLVAIQAAGRATAQVAANASVATYTVGAADGSFEISTNVNVTASTTHSFTVTCTYTDEGNTSRTLTLPVSQLTGTIITAITNVTGVGAYEGVALHIRAKASTAITIATAAGGTYTSVTYNVEGIIRQMS